MKRLVLGFAIASLLAFGATTLHATIKGTIDGGKHDGLCVDDDSFKTGHSNHADEVFVEGCAGAPD
jgi:hypothetical protein